ncbi:MAG: F0F1 ATP synthase subunit A [Deltaproteobacteria bacterium]|nr:F0F1 ATP synthase subunit A [Deltaproteobacteria bacterium]
MPDHSSWFTYLLSLPGFHNLWVVVNRAACLNAETHEVRDLGPDGACEAGFAPAAVAKHGSYPAGTDVTIEATVTLVFVLGVIGLLIVLMRARLADKEKSLVPEGELTVTSFVENFTETFYGLLRDFLGKDDARNFMPVIGTCAFFIFFSNALGLIPGFVPPTSNFNVTLACGLIVFVSTHYYGFRRQGLAYLKHFLGPVLWLAPLMIVLEVISHMVRPLSLAIRLAVNLFVDHLMVGVFTALTLVIVPVPIMLLGVLVVVLQTYVFCLLATVYIQGAIEHHEEHPEGGAHEGHAH